MVMKMSWFNFKTEQYDFMDDLPDDPTDYLPQNPAALGLYKVYVEGKHLSHIDAYIKVLQAYLGKEEANASNSNRTGE